MPATPPTHPKVWPDDFEAMPGMEAAAIEIDFQYRHGRNYVSITIAGETVYLTPKQAREVAAQLPQDLEANACIVELADQHDGVSR